MTDTAIWPPTAPRPLFFSSPKLAPPEYFCSPGHSASGVYSIHINAFFDLDAHIYTDAILQPVHEKNEFGAFCDIVDRHGTLPGRKNVYIGDRGYCSYNNMAHVVEQGQYFLFRTKDIHSKGLVGNFEFPETESFDIDVAATLTRSHSGKISIPPGTYRRFIDQASAFDFIEYGSPDTYTLTFRIARFPIGDDSYECIVTNLPREEFSPERLKALYYRRWSILYEPCFYTNFSDKNALNIEFHITKSSYKVLSLIQESETALLRHLP